MPEENFGSSSEQKKMINKIKYDLEGWREIILLINSVLKWERQYYAGVIFGITSFMFLLIWYLDFSILTLFSIIALIYTLTDYMMPMFAKIVFKPNAWTGIQEKQYEEICTEICIAKTKISNLYTYVFGSNEDKSPMFYLITCITLLFLAYIGAVIDNLFLTYIAALAAGLYPGLSQHGIIKIIKDKVCGYVSVHLNGVIGKVSDLKKSK